MNRQIKKNYEINAPAAEVWKALTEPRLIKQYFFGTQASGEWKEGGQIVYEGTWEGKPYRDIGVVLECVPEKLLTINHWSNRSGKPDSAENYSPHSYKLKEVDGKTKLTIIQEDRYKSTGDRIRAWTHWDMVIDGLKNLLEK